jgi:hypothetical protein
MCTPAACSSCCTQNYTNEFVHAFFEFIATSATSQRSRLARLCAPDAFLVPDAAILLQGRQKSNVVR